MTKSGLDRLIEAESAALLVSAAYKCTNFETVYSSKL